MTTTVLREDALGEHEGRLRLRIGLPWMRSLPLTSIRQLHVAIDGGELVTPAIVLAGAAMRLDELRAESGWALARSRRNTARLEGDPMSEFGQLQRTGEPLTEDCNVLPSVSPEALKVAFRQHPAGVTVITADDGSGPVGLTANSVASVSADPPLIVFSASRLSSTTPVLLEAETMVVHFVDAKALDVAKLCATSGVDRFADTSMWRRLPTGEPVFTGVRVWLRGKVVNRYDACGSTLIVLHIMESSIPEGQPLPPLDEGVVYRNRQWHRIGDDTAHR